jgi:phenolic acid decarboxylase
MSTPERAAAISGKTLRWSWTEGPTQGKTHEHSFHADGSVEYCEIDGDVKGKPVREKEYAAVYIAEQVYLVSYQSSSGYTLTVAVDFNTHSLVGFASGAKDWYPIKGRFEEV